MTDSLDLAHLARTLDPPRSWMEPAGAARGTASHLVASSMREPTRTALCGEQAGLWVFARSRLGWCGACEDALRELIATRQASEGIPDRSPQPPSVESEALPEGVPAAREDFGAYEALGMIPEGATPLYAISIVSMIDEDGDQMDELHVRGVVTTRDALGSIEAMKFRLLLQAHGIGNTE